MKDIREQAEIFKTAQSHQQNEELYNSKKSGKKVCESCGYTEGSVACRKKCHGETGGRYSWLFFFVALIAALWPSSDLTCNQQACPDSQPLLHCTGLRHSHTVTRLGF